MRLEVGHVVAAFAFVQVHAAIAITAAVPSAAAAARFALTTSASAGAFKYSVSLDGVPWLESAQTWMRCDGKTYSVGGSNATSSLATVGGSLAYQGKTLYTGTDTLGAFTATSFAWEAPCGAFQTTFREYPAADAIVFEQAFPHGASGCSVRDMDKVVSSFPSFAAKDLPGAPPLGALVFAGDFTGYFYTASQLWGNESAPIAAGSKASGPIVLFTQDQASVSVLSPYSEYMSASAQYIAAADSTGIDAAAALSYGVTGNVTAVPAGYSVEFLLKAGPKAATQLGGRVPADAASGINAAMMAWGDVLLSRSGKARGTARARDLTLRVLGYSTSQGAYYYYNQEKDKTYEQTLLDVHAYGQREELPWRYWLLDSWWYYKGPGPNSGGVVNWTAMPSVFPHNMSWLYEHTGMPVQGHNRFWSNFTDYAVQNGGPWDFTVEPASGLALPNTGSFWDWLLRESKKWGLIVYEQDWLDAQFDDTALLQQNPLAARRWLQQMSRAVDANGMAFLLCMTHVRHVLASVEMAPVTQVRASWDYFELLNNQWNLGTSAILAWSLGLHPSKDNYWTTAVQHGNPFGENRTEPFSRLEAAAAALSTGPVAVSDGVGNVNRTLLLRTCMSDGTLLQPARPATAIDGYFVRAAFGAAAHGPVQSFGTGGPVLTTESVVSGHRFVVVLAAFLGDGGYALSPGEMGYGALSSTTTLAAFEANTTQQVVIVDAAASPALQLAACDKADFQLYSVAQRTSGQWTLLGEVDKWVAVSPTRFKAITSVGGSGAGSKAGAWMRVSMQGAPGETINVAFLPPDSSAPIVASCTATESTFIELTMPGAECR